ncbi:glycosyltransferase family 2 protein [Algoriphagus vanfongensis]|uniref:glycosyltransferase family 2 protein n=1 Tax=Algoriphagus vanfongensis TaxID=426371 RepID=UPI0009FF984E|nr:glycosyltransferase [Algoriphagus vanfongensis]
MKIAVLLTCFNRCAKTRECLRNLYGQQVKAPYQFEVFLCDDGSSDGTSQMLSSEFPQVNVVMGDGHLYWGGGMRMAWDSALQSSDFDAFLWLNDDTYLLDNALNSLFEEFEHAGRKSILTAACKGPLTGEFSYGGHLESMIPVVPNGSLQEVYFINGNLTLIPRIVVDAIGLISTKYTHFLGDFDYGVRAKKAGFKCFTTTKYLAECEANPMPDWADSKVPLKTRWKMAHDVKGRAISEYIAFKTYHHGALVGVKSWIDTYLKLIFTDKYVSLRNFLTSK